MNEKLKHSVSTYLFWQSMVGAVLSLAVIVILLCQNRSFALWRAVYSLIPAAGCLFIYLSAAVTLKHFFGCPLPPLSGRKKLGAVLMALLIMILEVLLYLL